MTTSHRNRSRARGVKASAFAALSGAALVAACSGILEVQSPTQIPATEMEANPNSAVVLVNGLIADFECAFGAYVVVSGLTGEELQDFTQTAARWPYDRRTVESSQSLYATNSCQGLGVYTPLQTARVSANNARRLLSAWTDTEVPNPLTGYTATETYRQQLIATTLVYEAYAMLLLGEGFCQTVFSTFDGTAYQYGAPITSMQAWQQAEDRFTEAVTIASALAGSTGATASAQGTILLRAARMGRARTRLNLGNIAGARTDAATIPATGYVFNASASTINARRTNRVFSENNVNGVSSSVGPAYRNLNDPRVVATQSGNNNALGVQRWVQGKYTTGAAPIPITQSAEAQLIIAEADNGADATRLNAINIVNTFRAAGNQTPLLATATQAEVRAAIIDQRRRALWLTGTHLGDIRRYNISLTPAEGTAYHAGGTYGPSVGQNVCLPLPDVESFNNPVIGG